MSPISPCPNCRNALSILNQDLGVWLLCPYCHINFVIPIEGTPVFTPHVRQRPIPVITIPPQEPDPEPAASSSWGTPFFIVGIIILFSWVCFALLQNDVIHPLWLLFFGVVLLRSLFAAASPSVKDEQEEEEQPRSRSKKKAALSVMGKGFSWSRFFGISAAKGRVSRSIGIPLTKSGRTKKVKRLFRLGGRKWW